MRVPHREILLAAVAVTLSAAAGEVAIRAFPPPGLAKKVAVWQARRVIPPGLMIPDAEIGWVMAPDFDSEKKYPGAPMSIRTNAMGLRDRECDLSDQVRRVLVLGDSYTFGYLVEAGETFPAVTERVLKERERLDVEVINAGVNGYGPLEELGLLRRIGPVVKATVVVLAFFEGNDPRNAVEYPAKLAMGEDGYLHHDGADLTEEPYSYLFAYLAGKARNVEEKVGTRRGIDLSEDAILGARLVAERNGGKFLLMLIPNRQSERARRAWMFRAYDSLLGVPEDVNSVIESFARARGIEVLNLSPIFDASAREDDLRFHPDGHFKPAGHRVAGEALAAALERLLK